MRLATDAAGIADGYLQPTKTPAFLPRRIVSPVRMTSCQIGQQGRISIYLSVWSAPISQIQCISFVLRVLVVQCFCDKPAASAQFINRKPTVSNPAPGIRLAATSICHCRSIVVSSVPGKSAEATPSMQTTIPVPTRAHLHPIYLCRSVILPYILPPQVVAQPDFAMQF